MDEISANIKKIIDSAKSNSPSAVLVIERKRELTEVLAAKILLRSDLMGGFKFSFGVFS